MHIVKFERIMKRFIFILFTLLIYYGVFAQQQDSIKTNPSKSQPTKKQSKWDNFVFGGNIALQFGTVNFVDISPSMGYFFHPRFLVGLGATYVYYKDNRPQIDASSSIYGYRVFTDYMVIKDIGKNLPIKSNFAVFAHAEYEGLNLDDGVFKIKGTDSERFWLHSFLLGGGIRQPIGKKASFNLTILYNFNADNRVPYTNPVLRIGFYF